MYCVLTYDAPHRKTQDLLFRLKALGHSEVTVAATPWQDRKTFTPLVPHRPRDAMQMPVDEFCRRLGFEFVRVSNEDLASHLNASQPELVLIGGAGILAEEVVRSRSIINSHPAYLPYVRGLDALKWAIYEGHPIGVTTHVISEEADAGFLIKQTLVPIYHWDTFHSLAYRQYETEIAMLAESIEDMKANPPLTPLDTKAQPVHRRMPHAKELRMLKRFQDLVDQSPIE